MCLRANCGKQDRHLEILLNVRGYACAPLDVNLYAACVFIGFLNSNGVEKKTFMIKIIREHIFISLSVQEGAIARC